MSSDKILTIDNVGTVLQEARDEASMTREKLGSISKVSRQTIHNIEEGGGDVGIKKFIKSINALDKELVVRSKDIQKV